MTYPCAGIMPEREVPAAPDRAAGAGALSLWVHLRVARRRNRTPGGGTERVIMKRLLWPLAIVIVPAILAGAGLLVAYGAAPAPAAPPGTTATLRPTAVPSRAITSTASPRPSATATARRAAPPRPHLAGPWAVVAGYYRDVDSRKYAKAWALISPGLATGQTYQQFVAGY